MSDFSKCVVFTMRYEGIDTSPTGSYSNHPLDKGGPTKYGISYSFAKGTGDIDLFDKNDDNELTPEDIKKLEFGDAVSAYKKYFWDFFHLDAIEDNRKCFIVFDASVNHGTKGATKLVQKALRDVGYDLKLDGFYGPKTEAALQQVPVEDFVSVFQEKRKALYEAIVRSNPSQKVFLKGWMNRLKMIDHDINYV